MSSNSYDLLKLVGKEKLVLVRDYCDARMNELRNSLDHIEDMDSLRSVQGQIKELKALRQTAENLRTEK